MGFRDGGFRDGDFRGRMSQLGNANQSVAWPY